MRRWWRRRGADRIVTDVAASIAGSLDMEETLRAIADSTQRVLRADRATCYVVSEDDVISGVYTTEKDPQRRAFLARTVGLGPRNVPIWRRQLAQEDPLLAVEDVVADPEIPARLAESLGCGAFIGVRIEHHSVVHDGTPALLGTIFCSYASRRRFTADDRATARTIAGLAALALANARLHSDTLRHLENVRRQSAANRHQALHDALTGLPNRVQFLATVRGALEANAAHPTPGLAVMMLDLDRFKEVNDTLGHQSGDALLQVVADRLRSVLRGTDVVARLGGDEFALLLPGMRDVESALALARKVHRVLAQPVSLQELTLDVEASIGIALCPDHGDDADLLMQRADVAMYVAKAAHSGEEVYSAEHDQYSPERLALIGELRRAIAGGELVLHFQPKVSLAVGRVVGVEALVRWQHPERGLLPPGEFIPLAEHTTLIRTLTLHVLDRSLEQQRRWRDEGIDVPVSVNLAVRHLLDLNFPDEVRTLLRKWGLDGSGLELEITESTLMSNPRRAQEVIERLRELGVRIAIDDFGTGYSSLDYLKRLSADVLKIDKSFVLHMCASEADAMIVRSTIDLGRNLGLKVVAEGIETEAAWERLRELGCDVGQGFYLGRPAPAEELTALLAGEGEVGPAWSAGASAASFPTPPQRPAPAAG
ncbi:MAG: bifunctional diguanylate cyclase/phosphodiesterase [Actinomycetota bacterium]